MAHIQKKTLQQNFHLIHLYVCFNNNKHYDLEMPNFPKKKRRGRLNRISFIHDQIMLI